MTSSPCNELSIIQSIYCLNICIRCITTKLINCELFNSLYGEHGHIMLYLIEIPMYYYLITYTWSCFRTESTAKQQRIIKESLYTPVLLSFYIISMSCALLKFVDQRPTQFLVAVVYDHIYVCGDSKLDNRHWETLTHPICNYEVVIRYHS